MAAERASTTKTDAEWAPAARSARRWGRAFTPREYDAAVDAVAGQTPHRSLTAGSLTALGLGGLIGAGIFVTVGMVAHDKAGPAITLSFLVAAVACIAVALCYCECASRVPVAGSAYAYAYAAVGELGAWLSGWNLAACYLLAGAAVSQGWSGYFQSLLGALGVGWPKIVGGAPFDMNPATGRFTGTGAVLDLPALLALAAITVVVCRGMRLSLRFNNLILALKLAVLGFVIGLGLAHFRLAHWIPFAPFGWGGVSLGALLGGAGPQAAGMATGMLAGAATVFFAFGGFEMLSAYSHECRRPRRDVPLAVIATIGLLTLLYVAVAGAITGMVPYNQISVSAPVSEAFRTVGMPWVQLLVAVGAVAGMTSVLLAVVMSLPRVLMGIGRDGLLPQRLFNRLHPVYGTPHRSVLLVGAAAALLGALLPLRLVMDTVMMATLAGYIAVCVFVLILRRRDTSREPIFRAPLGPVVPLFGIAVCLLLMLSLPPVNWLRIGAWWAVGLAIYLARRALGRDARTGAEGEPSPGVAEEAPSPATV
jgi:basic amino acid/polyamine antiporter, APA family